MKNCYCGLNCNVSSISISDSKRLKIQLPSADWRKQVDPFLYWQIASALTELQPASSIVKNPFSGFSITQRSAIYNLRVHKNPETYIFLNYIQTSTLFGSIPTKDWNAIGSPFECVNTPGIPLCVNPIQTLPEILQIFISECEFLKKNYCNF